MRKNAAPMTDPPAAGQYRVMSSAALSAPCAPSFREVYARGYAHVWRTLRRLGVAEQDLEDQAHDVFLVVHRRLDDYDPGRPLTPWLSGIAFRVMCAARRRAHRRREYPGQGAWIQQQRSPEPTPEGEAVRREQRALVLAALGELDLDKRMVFIMHELDGIACPEIARTVGAPLNTVYSRLRAGRRRFAEAVDRLRGERRSA